MRPSEWRPNPADRAGEPGLRVGARVKPPVLSRATQRWLCLGALAVIFYGTLGPLGTAGGHWLAPAADFHWCLPAPPADANDLFTNVAVYVPVGLALRLLLRRRCRAGWPDLLGTLLLATGASYATELLQQFMPHRTPSLTDVVLNAGGALGGAVLAVPVQRLLRRVHERAFVQVHGGGRWALAAWIAVAAVVALETMPWSLKRPALTLGLDKPFALADPLCWARAGTFAVVAFILAGAELARGAGPGAALRRVAARASVLALGLELAQSVLGAHVASLLHALVASAGAALGAATAVLSLGLIRAQPRSRTLGSLAALRRFAALLLVGLVAGVVALGILPAVGGAGLRAEPAVQWIPLRAHFAAPLSRALADLLAHGLLYALLTLLCLVVTGGRGRTAALLLLASMLVLVETCRAFQAGRSADTTPLLLALAGWAATVRLWAALHPRDRRAIPAAPSPPRAPQPAPPPYR